MNLVKQFEKEQIQKLLVDKTIPEFKAGDTIRINLRIVEGASKRVQAFEGVVIGKKNNGIDTSCIVRKISHGEGVEKNIKLYSPMVQSVEVIRQGVVRRAKIYYLRNLRGKSARIKEKLYNRANTKVEK